MSKLNFSYDEENDELTIEGIAFPGCYFRSMAQYPNGEFEIYTSTNEEGHLLVHQRYTPPKGANDMTNANSGDTEL